MRFVGEAMFADIPFSGKETSHQPCRSERNVLFSSDHVGPQAFVVAVAQIEQLNTSEQHVPEYDSPPDMYEAMHLSHSSPTAEAKPSSSSAGQVCPQRRRESFPV